METTLQEGPHVKRALELEGPDHETLLVTFLSELLYIGEMEGQGFDLFEVSIEATRLSASLHGAPIAAQRKEIKAVTYHNLAIRPAPSGLQVTIVFDV